MLAAAVAVVDVLMVFVVVRLQRQRQCEGASMPKRRRSQYEAGPDDSDVVQRAQPSALKKSSRPSIGDEVTLSRIFDVILKRH